MRCAKIKSLLIFSIILFSIISFLKEDAAKASSDKNKIIVLGFDGVDFDLTKRWLEAGELPNLKKLQQQGTFSKLLSTNPAESPVSWSALITGSNPGKTGVFDFLTRDPATYYPDFSTSSFRKGKFLFNLFPIKRPVVTSNRGGVPFWETASRSGIKSVILKAPVSFPPDKLKGNKTLSGLGVPDIRGTMGTFSYYATDLPDTESGDTEMGGKIIKVRFLDNKVATVIFGPRSPFEKGKSVMAPLFIERSGGAIRIKTGEDEDTLSPGAWSKWFTLKFKVTPVVTVPGSARFFLISGSPELRLYMSPVNIHPERPLLPISNPSKFSGLLKEDIGFYKTLGWPTETWALNENRIDEEIYLQDLNFTFDEEERLLFNELAKKDWQILTIVFQGTDHVQHMFWRYLDKGHPAYDAASAVKYKDTILNAYKRMDEIVGRVLERMEKDATLFVISDHGFNSFRNAVNINTYLAQKGFMRLTPAGGKEYNLEDLFGHGEFWPNVDWSNTRAYALGLGQIYINLKGRERDGVVEEKDYDKVCDEIISELKDLRDVNGKVVIKEVYKGKEIYNGPCLEKAPDLVVGFNDGYRVSWQTSLGGIPRDVIVPNKRRWSGDHCSFDPSITEGIFFSNRKFRLPEDASVIDIAPTILGLFGIPAPEDYDGRSFDSEN